MRKYRVYYALVPRSLPLMADGVVFATLPETHRYLGEFDAHDPEDLFCRMQCEMWSPNGEAKPLIEKLGLTHTSMSIGDVLEDTRTGEWFYVQHVGFGKLQ